jgi:hypothetical protein
MAKKKARKLKIETEKPKRPLMPFFLFLKTLDRKNKNVVEFSKEASEKWKSLSNEEKSVIYKETIFQLKINHNYINIDY